MHIGSERAFGRLIFVPIAIALSSVYMASIVPIRAWAHSFGMGGLFGDTIVGSLLSFIPLSSPDGILAITVTSLFLTIILNIFCSGFIGSEIKKIVEFLFSSSKITFSLLSIIFAKIVSYVIQKSHSKTGQIGLGGNMADPYEGSFVPRAPGFNQVNSPNLYNDGSDPNASSGAPRIFKQEGHYHEEGGSEDIFSNPRLSSKISAAVSSRFQSDQEDLSQET